MSEHSVLDIIDCRSTFYILSQVAFGLAFFSFSFL